MEGKKSRKNFKHKKKNWEFLTEREHFWKLKNGWGKFVEKRKNKIVEVKNRKEKKILEVKKKKKS